MTPLQVPLAVKILIGLAVLWWVNGVAPEIARAVLVLVVVYLALANAPAIAELVAIPIRGLSATLTPPAGAPPGARLRRI